MGEDPKLEEWTKVRELLYQYDDRIHDVRKYGFSFVTALLTAQALILPNTSSDVASAEIKGVIIFITLLLILALAFFEKSYHLIQEAAAQRGLILEIILNLNLTETLSYQFHNKKVRRYEFSVYIIFVITTIVFGAFIVPDNYLFLDFLAGISLGLFYLIYKLNVNSNTSWPGTDWSVDPLECESGTLVKITMTQLDNDKTDIEKDDIVWRIWDQDKLREKPIIEQAKSCITIHQYQSHTWLWDTKGLPTGVYRIYPLLKKRALRRTVIIHDKNDKILK